MTKPDLARLSLWAGRDVSCETQKKLEQYVALLRKWNPAINLVSPGTLDAAWERHIADSLQLVTHLPDDCPHLYDLGSGGGFPGMIIAMLRPDISVALVDSDRRKGEFLRTVSRETSTPVTVLSSRVESLTLPSPSLITARGFAPINIIFQLLASQQPHISQWLLLKGREYAVELRDAEQQWHFHTQKYTSLTDPNSAILKLTDVQPRE